MAGSAQVTITFTTTHPMAMVMDWTRGVGLLDTLPGSRKPRIVDLQIDDLEISVAGDARLGPDDNQP